MLRSWPATGMQTLSSCSSCSMSACRLPASSLISGLRMGTISVHSTAMVQQLMPGTAYNYSRLLEYDPAHIQLISLKSTRRAYTAHFGAPTTIVLAEPGPGRKTSACLLMFKHRSPTTYGAQLAPLCARSKGHHSLLRHEGTIIVPTALQAFM